MKQTRVGFALCGSYCTYEKVLATLKTLTKRYEHVVPIMSENSAATDSRFGTALSFRTEIETLCRC
jgi:dipicolinate synthase subunit B